MRSASAIASEASRRPGRMHRAAGLLAAAVLALGDPALAERLEAFRSEQTRKVLEHPDPRPA